MQKTIDKDVEAHIKAMFLILGYNYDEATSKTKDLKDDVLRRVRSRDLRQNDVASFIEKYVVTRFSFKR